MRAEGDVAERVRARLGAPADLALAGRAAARAARSRRRRWIGLGAGAAAVTGLVATSLLAPGWPTAAVSAMAPAAAPPPQGSTTGDDDQALRRAARAGLQPDAMLGAPDLAVLVPGAGLVRVGVVRADDANDARGRGGPPTAGPVTGGWCGDSVLPEVTQPLSWWVTRWVSSERASLGSVTPAATQQVLRFATGGGAAQLVTATAASPTRCFSSADPSSAGRGYALLRDRAPSTGAAAVAVAPVANVEGTWSVRALGADGPVVVDLTLTLPAPSAEVAGAEATGLLDVALERAVTEIDEEAVA